MVICAAFGCSSRSGRDKLSFFKFPKDKKLRNLWVCKIGRACTINKTGAYVPNANSRVCSLHFKDDCYVKTDTILQSIGLSGKFKKRLKDDAVPTIFQHSKMRTRSLSSEALLEKRRKVPLPTMADGTDNKTPMDVIEGYQVYSTEDGVAVKQEPVDPDYDQENVSQEKNKYEGKIRTLLKQMIDNKEKKLTVSTVVESLLQGNEELLSESDTISFKPNATMNKGLKNIPDPPSSSQSNILTPKDPTASCSQDNLPNVNDALVEVAVNEAKDSNCDPDLVCAIGSKIVLMTPTGQALQMDITSYWCNFCSFRSEKKEMLLQHIMEHRFLCKYCKFQSFSRAAVIRHCSEEHEHFTETSATLKYCTYLPDLLQRNELNKRKQSWEDGDAPKAKRVRANPSLTSDTNKESDRTVAVDTSVMNTSSESLPVISSVLSGQQAVSAAMTTQKATTTTTPRPAPKPPSAGVTVSSGLCWNCGYCGFVTLSQSFLKIHLNAQHQGKAHKYVAMLVSSEEEMAQIKASDAQLVMNPSGAGVTGAIPVVSVNPATPVRRLLPAPIPKSQIPPGIEIDNAESDIPRIPKIMEELVEEKKIPVSYKCAHCNFSAPQEDKVKGHLFQRHRGCVIYALDMKAVKLRQKRYIFFCLSSSCDYQTKDTDEYLQHTSKCTPWLDGGNTSDTDSGLVKSLELTKNFIEKTASGVSFGRDIRVDRNADYACIYCSYVSNNNTRLKKHVITNHGEKATIIKDVPASKAKRKSSVYFCNKCLWETKEGSELEIHLAERHNANSSTDSDAQFNLEGDSDSQSSAAFSEKEEIPTTSKSGGTKGGKNIPAILEDSDSLSSEPSEVGVADEEDNDASKAISFSEYEDLVPSDLFEKALAAYIFANEQPVKKRGRPPRNAAVKCRLKVKATRPPTLYKCVFCNDFSFGTKLIRAHIQAKHKNEPLYAIDVLKQGRKNPQFHAFFCPVDQCDCAEAYGTDIVNHAKNKHSMVPHHVELVRISSVATSPQMSFPPTTRVGRPSTAATGESYECLYCNESKFYHSRKDMKKHLIDKHNGEEFLFRDCIARKLRQPSRFYMCHNFTCDFTSEKQKDYLLHMLGHQKAKIYECSRCQWFTSVASEITSHLTSVHDNVSITTLEINLDLDSQGNTIKKVGGTVIKTEKS